MPELIPDGPNDDRTDHALRGRSDAYEQAGALQWLMESAPAPKPEAKPARSVEGAAKTGSGALSTIVTGFGEAPRQALGGIRDAAQSTLEFGDWVGQYLPGDFYEGMRALEAKLTGVGIGDQLPDVGEPKTAIGSGVRAISQFLAPFGVAGKLMGGLRPPKRVSA